ncbi:MAG TPA: alkaline phosphatase family protein [Polyangia bacterium]|jgi:hypothetical protein|nr:alkaline phosphatase family protein [Polyangia bacterium]
MAPQRDSLLAILVDGARPDVIARLVAAGEMPVMKRTFFDVGGFRHATSVFPSVSGPAHLPILTGAHPGRANLPGIRWAERPGPLGFLFRTRSYMSLFRQLKLAGDVSPEVRTLFQHVEGLADVNTWFVRGCPARARRTRFSKAAAFLRSLASRDWYASDLQAERAVVRSFQAGFPSAFAVFPAVDELGHRFGPLGPESDEAYRRFDAALGRVIDALVRLGRLDRTRIVLTSDHGQSTTHTHFEVAELVAQVYPRTLSYPKLWRHMFGADAAVMVSGNAMANVYLAGERGWREQADVERAGGRPGELLARLLAEPAVDQVVYRRWAGGETTAYVVVARRDGQTARAIITPERARPGAGALAVRYRIEGADPFGYGPLPARMTAREVAALTADSDYPDAPWQIGEFFRSPRAGDLIVCARPGYDLRARFEYQPHNGSHGALHRQHMLVPAAVNGAWQAERLRSVDLFPSILASLGKELPEAIDGAPVPVVDGGN